LGTLVSSLLSRISPTALVMGVTQRDPLRDVRPADCDRVATLDYIRTGAITVDSSFEEYLSRRDKKVRSEIKRRHTRLLDSRLDARLEVIRDEGLIHEAVAQFGEMESSGWKGQAGTAIHGDNRQGIFYASVLKRLCRAGRARVYRYSGAGRLLAMQLCIEDERTLVFLKTTYDESLRAHAPGILMKVEIFRHVFEEGKIKRIEFYGVLSEWQRKWINEARQMYHVNYYRSSFFKRPHELFMRWRKSAANAPGGIERQPSDSVGA
jgi:hypothetical protein